MHPNNRIRRQKYQVARFFGATVKEATYAKDLGNNKLEAILKFLVL